MFSRRLLGIGFIVGVGLIVAVTFGAMVSADNSWWNYHWARTTDSFDLVVINSTTTDWDPYVIVAVADWSNPELWSTDDDPISSVLELGLS